MGLRLTDDDVVAFYDDTSGVAFGPIFNSHGDAEDFLDWIKVGADEKRTFKHNTHTLFFVDDPRQYRAAELMTLYSLWRRETRDTDDDL
jgi:hypothetical protein